MRKKIILILVGAAAPIFFIVVLFAAIGEILTGSAAASQAMSDAEGGGSVSGNVLAYEPLVSQKCTQYGIPEYVSLVLAVMQQESGGSGNDPMQCSECPDNLDYPNEPNGITDPKYSIAVGVEYLASCLRAAGCASPSDTEHISLALQGYNFGGGYIAWAETKGGYSLEDAEQFSQMKAQELGTSGYGDVNYVSHVLRYYTIVQTLESGYFICPIATGSYSISRGYGYDAGVLHKGVDLAAAEGTKITASAPGTVKFAGFGSSGNGYDGYGNVILIQHDNGYETLYGHCNSLLVSAGEKVRQGQLIALVGSTGDSTGNHCHFEIRINGSAVDPMPYLKMQNKME
jgi:hypothetical protein